MCGGLLAPDAQKELSRFNLTLPKRTLADPWIFSVRTLDLDSGLTRYYQRHYINLNRLEFNRYLISLILSSVKIEREAQCTVLERTADGCFKVGYCQRGTVKTVRAKYVVGADGAAFKVRARFSAASNFCWRCV